MDFQQQTPPETTHSSIPYASAISQSHYNTTDQLLEDEKQSNQKDNWNKLDKTTKLQLLMVYAESYGEAQGMSATTIADLKRFFRDSVEKGKFQKAKDVVYDKMSRQLKDIPSLHFNNVSNNFTLRNLDTKKVSLLKSLTPKRLTAKNITPVKSAANKLSIQEDTVVDSV